MKRIDLENNLYVLQFPPIHDSYIGTNITVLEHKNEIILIDAGYERHMKEVRELLGGKKIKYVILSHMHPDHCYGLHKISRQNVIASDRYLETLELFDDQDDDMITPSITVSDELEIEFGPNKIHIKTNPGHSSCGVLITINNTYILAGDEIMFTNDLTSILPYVAVTVPQHKEGLTNVLNTIQNHHILIPAHGGIIRNMEFLRNDIMVKLDYFDFLLSGNKDFEVFKDTHNVSFEVEKWHLSNIDK